MLPISEYLRTVKGYLRELGSDIRHANEIECLLVAGRPELAIRNLVGSILVNYFTTNTSLLLGLGYLVPLFIGSLFVAKVLTLPFVRLFGALEKDHDGGAQALGRVCTVLLPATTERLGQAAVRIDGAPLMLNVRALSRPLAKRVLGNLKSKKPCQMADRNILSTQPGR